MSMNKIIETELKHGLILKISIFLTFFPLLFTFSPLNLIRLVFHPEGEIFPWFVSSWVAGLGTGFLFLAIAVRRIKGENGYPLVWILPLFAFQTLFLVDDMWALPLPLVVIFIVLYKLLRFESVKRMSPREQEDFEERARSGKLERRPLWDRSRLNIFKKKWVYISLSISFGFIVGFLVMAYASMQAVDMFTMNTRLNYRQEQKLLALQAKRAGDLDTAIMHYKTLIYDYSTPGLYTFNLDKAAESWTLFSPLYAPILRKMFHDTLGPDHSERYDLTQVYWYRKKLAAVLDMAGHTEEANFNYSEALRIFGRDRDIESLRGAVKNPSNIPLDDITLKLQEMFTYPQSERNKLAGKTFKDYRTDKDGCGGEKKKCK